MLPSTPFMDEVRIFAKHLIFYPKPKNAFSYSKSTSVPEKDTTIKYVRKQQL